MSGTIDVRENWGTRAGFVLAAIGSAVGLGNLWGFPYKLYSHGGGAFLIPYFIGMLIVGIPMLILEFSLGHLAQKASPDAFRSVSRRSEVIGWAGIILGFFIITYYAVILAWCLQYLLISLQGIANGGELPWTAHGAEGIKQAKTYFFDATLNTWDQQHTGPTWALGSLSRPIVWCLLATWVMIFLCIFRGVRLVSRIVLWTVPLPWLMLMILVVRGLTLPGAADGLEYYLQPDWTQLARPDTWRYAFGQVFFSMSLAFGVMLTYASFLHRKSDINNNAAIIGLGDLATSFIAGIAIFATLGAMAATTGQAVTDVADAGPSLAFVVFPYALAQFEHSAWFSAVFFFALITLGIDSGFSIAEAVLASLVDKLRWNRLATLTGMCVVACGIGLAYCTRGGLTWLGAVDDYINGPGGILLVGLLQCLALGWGCRISRLRHHANERSDWRLGPWWDWLVRIVIPTLLSALFAWMLLDLFIEPGFFSDGGAGVNAPHVVWALLALAVPLGAIGLSAIRSGDDNTADHDETTGNGAAATAGLIAAAAAAILAAAAFVTGLQALRVAESDPARAAFAPASALIAAAAIAGMAALVLGSGVIVAAEANRRLSHVRARLAAAAGVFVLGTCLGLAVPIWIQAGSLDAPTAPATPAAAAAEHLPVLTGEQAPTAAGMSGISYAIMAVTLLVIFGGLMWCFTMALRAAGADAPDQDAEDMSREPTP